MVTLPMSPRRAVRQDNSSVTDEIPPDEDPPTDASPSQPLDELTPAQRDRAFRWMTALPLPMPWAIAESIHHPVTPIDLLRLPMVFSQNDLLSPEEFINEAKARGRRLEEEHLHELHRIGALVPLYRVMNRPVGPEQPEVPSAVVAREHGGYSMGGSNGLLFRAYGLGHVVDPATRPYRSWAGGIPVRRHNYVQRYPSVFYSPYQLLGLLQLEAATRRFRGAWNDDHSALKFTAEEPLDAWSRGGFDRGRQLAILLHAIDSHFLPPLMRVAYHGTIWRQEDQSFSAENALEPFGIAPKTLAKLAGRLLSRGSDLDPLGPLYKLTRFAYPDTWKKFKGDARLAMDFRIAAEMLLRALDESGHEALTTGPKAPKQYHHDLDDRIPATSEGLDHALMEHDLSPNPSVLLVLEGRTEMLLMPKVLEEIYQSPIPPTLVETVLMDTVDRNLDLLVRHVIGLRFGDELGSDMVQLARTPSKIFVAVDPEHGYATPPDVAAKKKFMVDRLFEFLDSRYKTPAAYAEIETLVTIETWGTATWEFANFNDSELATALKNTTGIPRPWKDFLTAVRAERVLPRPNIENAANRLGRYGNKMDIARSLMPVLERNVRRRMEKGTLAGLPAGRIGEAVLHMALTHHRRSVALKIR
jgi:hypothetical protein